MSAPVEAFSTLTAEEVDLLTQVPVWITALVGGADGNLDRTEREWSEHIVRIRTYAKEGSFDDYYRLVAQGFAAHLEQEWQNLPADVTSRSRLLADKIAAANPILSKLDPPFAATLYKSYLRLAEEVAKASGGFLRMGAISPEENTWIKLPMLTPIYSDETDLFAHWEEEEEKDK